MIKTTAEALVQSYLNEQAAGFSVMPEATMEAASCFAVFYQTDEFIKTRRFSDMAVGQGPTIVAKKDGQLFHTGSGRFVEDSIAAFEKYGDPYKEKDTSKIILSITEKESYNFKSMILYVKKVTGKGIVESKKITTDLLQGGTIQFDNNLDIDERNQLETLGFKIDHPWLT